MLRLPVKREKKPSLIFLKPFFSLFHAAVMDFLPFIACHAGVRKKRGQLFLFLAHEKGEGRHEAALVACYVFRKQRREGAHALLIEKRGLLDSLAQVQRKEGKIPHLTGLQRCEEALEVQEGVCQMQALFFLCRMGSRRGKKKAFLHQNCAKTFCNQQRFTRTGCTAGLSQLRIEHI